MWLYGQKRPWKANLKTPRATFTNWARRPQPQRNPPSEARGTEDQCRELIDQIAVKRTTYRETAAEIDRIRGIDPNLMRERCRTVNDSENELKTRRKATEQELATVATDLKKLGEAGNAEALEAADRRLQHRLEAARHADDSRNNPGIANESRRRKHCSHEAARKGNAREKARREKRTAGEGAERQSAKRDARRGNAGYRSVGNPENVPRRLSSHAQR